MRTPSYSDTLYADIQPSYSDSLAHHGIKGMRWGVRRFQNPDGTRTSAGKSREKRKRKGLSKKQKALLKTAGMTALGVGIGAAALYGTSKSADNAAERFREEAEKAARNARKAQAYADAYKYTTEANEKRYSQYQQQANSRGSSQGNQNGSSSDNYDARSQRGQNTSNRDDRKRREEKAKASGKTVSYEEASKRVKDLRDRVAQAQRDGTLTPDLVDELKDAQAQARVAKQQMNHAVWIINADENYLMHHGIKGQKWGVRRFETAAGHLTSAGKKRYEKYQNNRQQRKAAKKQARSERLDNIKNTLTSDKAKNTYKKVAKGAAITAGVLAAGYGATLVAQGVRDQKNINKARELADNIIAGDKSLSKLGDAGKSAVRQKLMSENLNRISTNQAYQKQANRQKMRDYANALKNPFNSDARSMVRAKSASGGYSVEKQHLMENADDQWVKSNRQFLKDTGRKADDPAAYERKIAERKKKAEQKAAAEAKARKEAEKKEIEKNAKRRKKEQRKAYERQQQHYKEANEQYARQQQAEAERMRAEAELLRARRGY